MHFCVLESHLALKKQDVKSQAGAATGSRKKKAWFIQINKFKMQYLAT